MKYLKQLDYYGVNLNLRYNQTENNYQSIQGGLITLCVTCLSLAYCIYGIVDWQNGGILPKSVVMDNPSENVITYNFTGSIVTIFYKKSSDSLYDPFNQTNLMLIPYVFQSNDTTVLFRDRTSPYKSQMVELMNGYISYNPDPSKNTEAPSVDLQILLAKCSKDRLQKGQQCASDADMDQFLKQGLNTFIVEFTLHQLSPRDGILKKITKTVLLTLDVSSQQNIQIIYNKAKAEVDKGQLLEQVLTLEFVSDVQIIALSTNLLQTQFKDTVYVVFTLRMDSLVREMWLTFPKFSDILSSIWAVASILIAAGELVKLANAIFLENRLAMEIVGHYYPQLHQLRIKYDLFGRILNISADEQRFDSESLKRHLQSLAKKAKIKLSYSNLLYEVSRLQFLMQHLINDRNKIAQVHSIGIPMQLPESSVIDLRVFPIDDPFRNFNDEDFLLLSMARQFD